MTMELQTLKKLVRQGEGLHVEFKLKAKFPEKIVREMAAFANAEGGTVFIGVSDDRKIYGLKNANEEEFVMVRALERYCSPPLSYSIEKVLIDDSHEVLAFIVPKSLGAQIHYILENPKRKTTPKRVYIRVADKTIQASKEMREILKGKQKQKNFGFQYGLKEQQLFKYLDKNTFITVKHFSQEANISRAIASRTLVLLVLAGVLQITPNEVEDRFCLASAQT